MSPKKWWWRLGGSPGLERSFRLLLNYWHFIGTTPRNPAYGRSSLCLQTGTILHTGDPTSAPHYKVWDGLHRQTALHHVILDRAIAPPPQNGPSTSTDCRPWDRSPVQGVGGGWHLQKFRRGLGAVHEGDPL